jgi:phage repressor protein C with HTH and peptisase S24 domain
MTGQAVLTEEAVRRLDGRLVVAVDSDGATYFKRLRLTHDSLVILESLNPDGTTPAELFSLDPDDRLPCVTHVLPVVGVLFELPDPASVRIASGH